MAQFDLSKLKHCGEDVRISSTVIFKYPELISVGNHVAIDDFCYVSTSLEVGDYVHIGPFCSIIGGKLSSCLMRDFSGLAAGCRLICGSDDYLGSGLTNPTVPQKYHAQVHFGAITLEKHALLGTNCVVHHGVTINEGAAVGSCSLVTKDLDSWGIYKGVPARYAKQRDKYRIIEMESLLRSELG